MLAANTLKKQYKKLTKIQFRYQDTSILNIKDIKNRKWLAKSKKKNKKAKQSVQTKKQNNYYIFWISRDLMQLVSDLVYKSNSLISLKNIKNPSSSS